MYIATLEDLLVGIWQRKVPFVVVFFVSFALTYAVLFALDFLPEPVPSQEAAEVVSIDETTEASAVTNSQVNANAEASQEAVVSEVMPAAPMVAGEATSVSATPIMPTAMTFTTLGRTVSVLNPSSRAIPDLDAALLEGVVRHPDSAHLGQTGTVFILGHSSYLPVVQNRNFQAFNGIQNLSWGDTITLTAEGATYTYRVDRVYRARASEVVVPIAGDEYRLTLATCNSFGSIDDRFIVEAVRVAVTPAEAV